MIVNHHSERNECIFEWRFHDNFFKGRENLVCTFSCLSILQASHRVAFI